MNQREAKQNGFNRGRDFQTSYNRLKTPENRIAQEKYNKSGEYFAKQATPYTKAQNLFLQGWQEAWEEPKPAPVVEHFESRFDFCTCEACNAKRAQAKPELQVCPGCPGQWCEGCTPDEQVYSC